MVSTNSRFLKGIQKFVGELLRFCSEASENRVYCWPLCIPGKKELYKSRKNGNTNFYDPRIRQVSDLCDQLCHGYAAND